MPMFTVSTLDPIQTPAVRVIAIATAAQWREAGGVLQVLRPDLDIEQLLRDRDRLTTEGYRLLGVIVGGEMVSVASYTLSPHVMLGRELLIHDMATLPHAQHHGYARRLIERIEEIALTERCGRIFVHTRQAQPLYKSRGFTEYSTGMIKASRLARTDEGSKA